MIHAMNVVITSEVLQSYSLCPRKAYLLMYGKDKGTLHEYEQILRKHQLENQSKNLELLKQKHTDVYSYSISNLKEGYEFLIDANLVADNLQAYCSMLTRTNELSYEPTIFIGTHTINNTDKLSLIFAGYILTKIQGKLPAVGHIVNMKNESRRLKLEESHKVLAPLLKPLQKWLHGSSPEEPPVILNKHCSICQFREQCQTKAIQEDNLSLLDRITPKEIRKYEKRGILTIKQLSYLFRPRKTRKRIKHNSQYSHKFELQALSLRTGKIYLQEPPNTNRDPIEIFLDIESIPDQEFYYLIGLLICQGKEFKQYSLWANDPLSEVEIWNHFLEIVDNYSEALIYHYGNFEQKAIAKLGKRYTTDIDKLAARLTNLNSYIFGKIYFPTYSNSLKEIGAFLGAKWTSPNASGLQSLVWRYKWELEKDSIYKNYLLKYNTEDCLATKLLLDQLTDITVRASLVSELDFGDRYKRPSSLADSSIHGQLEAVIKFSYTNIDKKKIRFREDVPGNKDLEPKAEKTPRPKNNLKKTKKISRPTRIQYLKGIQKCPTCEDVELKESKSKAEKFIINLVFSRSGVRKAVIKYCVTKGFCPQCKRYYIPNDFRKRGAEKRYGNGFNIWFAYQRVTHRLSHHAISELTEDLFNEKIDPSTVTRLIKEVANFYSETEGLLIKQLQDSHFIHVDETTISIRGVTQYVWVFTNGLYVVFQLTETREATVVQSFLKNYKGILISDFYSGYDSVECKQQKCWVHLIRDLNTDLWKSPLDSEFEKFVQEIKDLIIPIMEVIQRHNLKKFYLNKFQKNVDKFYQDTIVNRDYKSELSLKYQKRFLRYRDSLFTFLSQDGIPWHNNTAENAIRHLALQRNISGNFYESGAKDYLRLLGIKQSCRFQGKSFFEFLFSGETDLDQFKVRKRKR
ncbi:IS66 family transposase [Leptolyngbya sp. PL-A3]|uniref:IS66 family transposase n=1 Tax=Leptolyngbya sp. PL-A3 TaxID=2933911 RepID=UPI003296A589